MIWRVVKVLWFMLNRILIHQWLRLTGSRNMESRLLLDFRRWSDFVLDTFDADLTIVGREHLPSGEGRKIIIMSNHQSQLDIPALTKAMDRVTGFVAKRELARIPLLHYWMRRLGCVIIDRSDKRGAHQALENAARQMTGKPLVVFPEGTRSRDGSLLPFKLGGTRLALLAQAIIVPVLIEGAREAVENTKAHKNNGGRIPVRLTIFPPLDTKGLDEGKASQNIIKEYVEKCWRNPNAPI